MTAAVYRWFLGLSGASLIAYTCVAAFVLVALVALAVEIVDRLRKPKRQVWPIPFVEPQHSDPWPLRVVLVFAALVLAIMFNCGFKGV